MSYTLTKLKEAKAAAERGDKETCLGCIQDLIDRMDLLLRTRKAWRPNCRKDHDNDDNGRAESGAQESLGQLGHTGDPGLQQVRERVRRVAPKDRQGRGAREEAGLHQGGESA